MCEQAVSGAAHRPHDQNDEVSSNAHSRLAATRWTRLPLKRLKIGDDIADLARIQLEFRHRGMTGDNPLGE